MEETEEDYYNKAVTVFRATRANLMLRSINPVDITDIIKETFKNHKNLEKSIIVKLFDKSVNSFKLFWEKELKFSLDDLPDEIDEIEELKKNILFDKNELKKKIKIILNKITKFNLVCILHEDKMEVEIIKSDTFDEYKDNIYFYLVFLKKIKEIKKGYEIKFRKIVNKDDDDVIYGIYHKSELEVEVVSTETAEEPGPEIVSTEAAEKISEPEPEIVSTEAVEEPEPEVKEVSTEVVEEPEPEAKDPPVLESRNQKYTYNPDDIHALLKKFKITNKTNTDDNKNGEYLLGNTYGYENQYQNIYKSVKKGKKYFLSGQLNKKTNKIVWLRLNN